MELQAQLTALTKDILNLETKGTVAIRIQTRHHPCPNRYTTTQPKFRRSNREGIVVSLVALVTSTRTST